MDAKTGVFTPAPSGLWVDYPKALLDKTNHFLFSENSATLAVGTVGIYTKHKVMLTDYTTAYSGVTIILTQATLEEHHNWQNYAILKIITQGTITTNAILTMEYKDHDDTTYNQFKNDVSGGNKFQMRIYHWARIAPTMGAADYPMAI